MKIYGIKYYIAFPHVRLWAVANAVDDPGFCKLKERIALIRGLLSDSGSGDTNQEQHPVPSGWVDLMIFLTCENPLECKECGKGKMVLVDFTGAYRIRDE